MPTVIAGVTPSPEVRAALVAEGRPILLAFSRGKDSIAAWLALQRDGVDVVPYHLYLIPHLRFVDDDVKRAEDFFQVRIRQYPHTSLYRWLNRFVFQIPERLATIEAANLPEPAYEDVVELIREDCGLPADTWVADGVRAADSPIRRLAFASYGPMKPKHHKVSPIWDWTKAETMEIIAKSGYRLPVDYAWFGRSFDGMDYRFLEPLSRNAPDDYRRIIDWFPLAELEMVRRELGDAT